MTPAMVHDMYGLLQAELLLQGQLAATKSSLADVTAKADASAQQVALLRGQLAAAESAAKQLMDSRNELEGGMLDGQWTPDRRTCL